MSKRPVQQQLFRVLALSLMIALIGGGIALLSQWHQSPASSHAASSDNVVGPPTLPAATVDAILRHAGSPMTGIGQAVETASRAANIDDAFALAVWWTETNDGAAGVGSADRNPGSVRGSIGYPSAYDGYTIYPSYTAAVNYWFPMLQRVYIARGLTTVTAISHPYVGTSTSYLWAGKVIALMQRYRAEAPAQPAATPTPPAVSANMQRVAKTVQQHAQAWAEPPVVVVQQQRSTQATTQASGLSASTERLLVLINLLLALALGLWAWNINRRATSSPQPVVQPVSNVWEQLQASNQQPAAFFRQQSLSGLRTTEGLSANLPNTGQLVANAPSTGMLAMNASSPDIFAATNPLQPAYRASGAPSSLRSFMANQPQQTPQPAPIYTGQLPFGESPAAFTEQLSFDAPNFAGQRPFNAPTSSYPQSAPMPGFGRGLPTQPAQTNMPTPNPLHRTRLQPSQTSANYYWPHVEQPEQPARQPQPVGAGAGTGRSNGLLSRYREAQEQR